MNEETRHPWSELIPAGDSISDAPSYTVGKYFDLFREDDFCDGDSPYGHLKYYFYDPTENGWPKGQEYPLLIFLHGTSNSLVGKTCINYSGAELFASPSYQNAIQGAYILVPVANERRGKEGVEGSWCRSYTGSLYSLIKEFISRQTGKIGNLFLFGNSSGATMALVMGTEYPAFFKAIIPVGSSAIPDDKTLDLWESNHVHLFYAIGQKDEFHDFTAEVLPRLDKLNSMRHCFIYTPEWVRTGNKGISSISAGFEMGQHCLINAVQNNLMFDDGTPMDERLPRGVTGWIDEVNRGAVGLGRFYSPHGGAMKTGHVQIDSGISLYFEEFGSGDQYILSAQCGFYHVGMHQRMAELGYHVYCITLRGFHPSSLVSEDYGNRWYDIFASDVAAFADRMGINRFTYMGASHGAGVGWHLMLQSQDRIDAFIAVVPGPHSLSEGTMSYRQMLEKGIISSPPPFDPPVDADESRTNRRNIRNDWLQSGPLAFPSEKKLDYGRPMMRFGNEDRLCEALRTISVPVLIIGGYDDPISTPSLMMRTLGCLPHCKTIIYSNCGHNIDTDLIEEVSDEADRFIANAKKTGKYYLPLS